MDRILPAPLYKGLERNTWGTDAVKPRDIHNGIEDPMVWRTDVQYHTIVNDWYGRTAYRLRSKDGVHWKMDPGEAYTIDFDGYEEMNEA